MSAPPPNGGDNTNKVPPKSAPPGTTSNGGGNRGAPKSPNPKQKSPNGGKTAASQSAGPQRASPPQAASTTTTTTTAPSKSTPSPPKSAASGGPQRASPPQAGAATSPRKTAAPGGPQNKTAPAQQSTAPQRPAATAAAGATTTTTPSGAGGASTAARSPSTAPKNPANKKQTGAKTPEKPGEGTHALAPPPPPPGGPPAPGGAPDGESRVLALALKGEWGMLEQLIRGFEKGTPEVLVAEEDTGITPLMMAVRENRLVLAERLLDLGCPVNVQAQDGRTALHFGASYSRDDVVKLLINRKADATLLGGPKEQLPLHMACLRASGVITTVQMLLKSSGKEGRLTMDKEGSIPAFLAAGSGNVTVCKELLSQNGQAQVTMHRQDNGDTLLHIACRKKDFEMAKLFVDSGGSVDAQNEEGHTPLHLSAWEGDETMIKFLHQCKANPNLTDKMDRSPLHIAAERGHTAIVEMLVDKFKANVAARTKDGSTLMHISSQFGHPETALAFLKKGVPMLMPNKSGAICLHAAAMKGHTSVIKALLQKGAPVDSRTKDHYTALHIAVEHCKPLVVQTLLGFGSQVELKGGKSQETPLHIAARVKDGEKCAEMLVKSGADVNATKENGETALHIAARAGQIKMVKALLEEAADPSWQSKAGETPLHISVRYCHWEVADELLRFVSRERSRYDAVLLVNTQNGEGETAVHYGSELTKVQAHNEFEDTDMIKLLLDYDGDTHIQTRLTGETPVHYSARAGNTDLMLEIVKKMDPNKIQAAVNKQAKNGWSPLLVASEAGHTEIVKILLQHHARVDVFDEHGKAALHLAAENGHDNVADVLLVAKAFVNAKSKLGLSPLHLAAQNGFNKLVKVLIEKHSATIDALSLAKKTPLHMAAQNGKIEVCASLLKMKADANAADVHGQSPLHLAAENDHSDVVKLFLKYRPELVTMANTNGMTCAHIAASKGSVAVVKELMRFNKSVVTTARNKTNDSTTLHLAAAGGHKEVVKVLLEAGAAGTDENADGMTAIHLAAKHGHNQILDVLKAHVSLKVTSTKTGLTALHVAAQFGQIDFVREMLAKVPATVRSEPPHTGDIPPRDMGAESGLTPLHLAAQSGHEGLVRLLLNSPGVQADAATNVRGVIPLHLAAQSGHTAVVSLLLSKSTSQMQVKDKQGRTGLHLAASNGHIDMVALLLGQGADINCYDKSGWTPLHYSAKAGHLKVVKLLVETGANPTHETKDGKVALCYAAAMGHPDNLSYLLLKEHNTAQLMDDVKFVFDLMSLGKMNDNQSIREFVLVSHAPADTAVKMSRAFRMLAIKEKERAKDLLAAGDFCEEMAVELNAIAAGINGAGELLKSVDNRGVAFLDVLIECEQKEVVSHASVQRYLSEVWTGHLSHWAGWKMMMLFLALLCIPPVWLAFSIPNRHIRFNKVPVIKFMSYLVSHLYLVILYTIVIVYPLVPLWDSYSLMPHWYEWILLMWLSGLLVSQLTNPEDRQGLGWIKVIVIAISNIGVFTHLLAFSFVGDDRLYCLHARNQFFGFALLLCFVQLLDFLSFHHLFGPWAIIIRDLMKDLSRFLVILAIFILGFTLQLASIYKPVTAPILPDADKGDGDGMGGAQSEDALSTFELLFFALFGLVDPENLPPVNRSPLWSLSLAKGVFGMYLIISIIVLINLLIAMMSDTYQRIVARADTEWKFGRAKLFRNMNKTSATPSPLNLFTKFFVYLRVLIKHKGAACSMDAQQYVDEEEDLGDSAQDENRDQGGWFKRRSTQISPEGSDAQSQQDEFVSRQAASSGPVLIEDVVDWKEVVDKYLTVQGLNDGKKVNRDDDGEGGGGGGFSEDSKDN